MNAGGPIIGVHFTSIELKLESSAHDAVSIKRIKGKAVVSYYGWSHLTFRKLREMNGEYRKESHHLEELGLKVKIEQKFKSKLIITIEGNVDLYHGHRLVFKDSTVCQGFDVSKRFLKQDKGQGGVLVLETDYTTTKIPPDAFLEMLFFYPMPNSDTAFEFDFKDVKLPTQ